MATLVDNLGGEVGFGEFHLTRNDDSYQTGVDLTAVFGAQGLNFFGQNFTYAAINNNGNITLGNNAGGGMSTYTPYGLQSSAVAMIAPFFGDVDTRNNDAPAAPFTVTPTPGGTSTGTNLVWYDLDPTGYGTMTVTWDDVGYYDEHADKLNAFQLQLVGRGNGNFDAIFRYETINWVTGDASGGTDGLGGTVARAGYSDGLHNWLELTQSGNQAEMLALDDTLGNTGEVGYYRFTAEGGTAGADNLQGGATDDILAGGAGDDTLSGGDGNDALYGEGGADTLIGGQGNDTYYIDQNDHIVESNGGGTDTVYVDWSGYVLPDFIENIVLNGNLDLHATGNHLNNRFIQNTGDNVIDGGDGIDTVSYYTNAPRSGFTISHSGAGLTVSGGAQGSDTLNNIERLQFSDGNIAFDLLPTQGAGQALEFIGALAHSLVSDQSAVGTILSLFDDGYSLQSISQLAIDVGLVSQLAGSSSNADLARLVFHNIVGTEADASMTDYLVGFMDGRSAHFSQAEFVATVAGLELNQQHIDLVGLQQSGVEYI